MLARTHATFDAPQQDAHPAQKPEVRLRKHQDLLDVLLRGMERLSGRAWTEEDRAAMARALRIESEFQAWRRSRREVVAAEF